MSGLKHWKWQKYSSLAAIFAVAFILLSVRNMLGSNYISAVGYFNNPLNSVLLALSIISVYGHAIIGVESIVLDYSTPKTFARIKKVMLAIMLAAIVAIVKLSVA
jgi:succinate dehydrogenase hydrophobic membrane anchor protein